MKTYNLIATAAAVLLTAASLGAVNFNVESRQASPQEINGSTVIDLAPVLVHPDAQSLRAALLLADSSAAGLATVPFLDHLGMADGATQFSLIGSQLAMPYYSFGKKFGRISKE
jgi:hypothetical protein